MISSQERVLALLKLLYEQTDETHPLTTNQMKSYFAELGITVDRKTIKSDIDTLIKCGFDVVFCRRSQNSYFIGSRLFELPELKLLIDAVESSKFITKQKSMELTGKLSSLSSIHQAAELKRHLYISDRVKSANEQIYYLVDSIHTAVNSKKQISFRYFEYNAQRKQVYRNQGKRYRFSPYGLTWNEDHYYAVGYSEKHQKIVTFRVDRMTEVKVLEQDGVPSPEDFSLPDFVREVFDMYDGHTERVVLHCQNEMMKVILDRFGDSVITQPIDNTCFRAEADISVSKTFYAWIFQFGGDIRIVSPDSVLQEYQEMLRKSLK